jgi:hypothetical protein
VIAELLILTAFLFLLLHLIQVARWSHGFQGAFSVGHESPKAPQKVPPKISLVLPVRNEAVTLPHLLADLAMGADTPDEVIIVDDASTDGTTQVISTIQNLPFSVRTMANPGTGKKPGLSAGIKAAIHPWVIQVDADVRVGPEFIRSVRQHIQNRGSETDMLLLPLRLAYSAKKAPSTVFESLQALDFAAMQGWAVAAARRGRPAMASGGAWVWRASAFPHDQLRQELASGDDVFSLAALIKRGDGHRVGWCGQLDSMASAAPMPNVWSLLDQRIRWGAKAKAYPKALSEARRVSIIIAGVHLFGTIMLVLQPLFGLAFWTTKAVIDMAYTHQVGRAYGIFDGRAVGRRWGTLVILAALHPPFIITTLLLMPFRKAPWKGRTAA